MDEKRYGYAFRLRGIWFLRDRYVSMSTTPNQRGSTYLMSPTKTNGIRSERGRRPSWEKISFVETPQSPTQYIHVKEYPKSRARVNRWVPASSI